ncbi:hypothetical protein [Pseudomonas savastanoi]|uniref:hypothetical protein n=1 Tax=Pseudomonas savastanoi TaxID=29438 RepID=UPI001782DF36|nr:hypothetical protein [Pseudomonas savastanoi]
MPHQSAKSEALYTRFEARVLVEGEYASTTQVFTPASLLEVALQHALVNMKPEAVADLVKNTTGRMLQSLSCKRRKCGDKVRLTDEDPDGYNGIYQIAIDRNEPTDCCACGSPLCSEWPTLHEIAPNGALTGSCAYHISECQMHDL